MKRHLPGKRVLIVEDNPALAYDLKDLLTELGVAPIGPALTLQTGLNLTREHAPDAALLDIDLGDGELVWPLASELQKMEVPVVFISVDCTKKHFPERFQKAVCLEKPATEDRVVEGLAGALAL